MFTVTVSVVSIAKGYVAGRVLAVCSAPHLPLPSCMFLKKPRRLPAEGGSTVSN